MDDAPRYASLRDYLQVLQRHKLLIAVAAVAFALGALVISIVQTPTYQASASLSFRDIFQDLRLIGSSDTVPDVPPAIRAAQNAQLVGRPEVTQRVKKDLHTSLTPAQLESAVSGSVGSLTNLVIIQAQSNSAKFAARLANAYATEVRKVGRRQVASQLDKVEGGLRKEIRQTNAHPGPGQVFQVGTMRQQLGRVETLRRIAEPVQIAARAGVPSSPSSPQTKRNVALGLVVGLFFGLLGAFVRDSLDRRLRSVHDVHEELGMAVLGRVPEAALGYPGLARNGRAAMSEADFEAFRVLRQNLGFLGGDRPLRSLLVTSGLPEEGKSTVSMSLASAAALAGQRVLLVECDLRRPSFASRLGIRGEPGLTDYLLGHAPPREVLQTVDLSAPTPSENGGAASRRGASAATLVCIVAGSQAANPAELLITDRFREFLGKVTTVYDLVVLDSSPVLGVVDPLELAPQVDGVIVCTRLQHTTRDEARAARAALSNVPKRPMAAVVTGIGGGADYYGYYHYED